ncbi:MAG TPA: alpha/beta hydrolase [Oryzihumus sp.]|nr:alpha/beta hydrolase [Oryzihumus sp.]
MSRMPLRTKVFTTLLDRLGRESILDMDLAAIRRSRASVAPTVPPFTWVTGPVSRTVTIEDSTLPARDGHPVPLRVYRPAEAAPAAPVLVWFHGGGWVLGSPRMYDPLCSHLAEAVGAVVVSVDYRKAPEHRAPQAVHDCVDATRWVATAGAQLGADPSRLAVSGDSAGGNLAAVVCQVVRDEGGPRIAHQALVYPATDATMSQPSVAEHAHAAVLTREKMTTFRAHYLGEDGLAPDHPLVSPLWAHDLSGLPPALVQTADLDPLRDEGARYAEALRAAGVPARLTNYPGAPHGFASFPGATTVGRAARGELVAELRRHLVATPAPVEDRVTDRD